MDETTILETGTGNTGYWQHFPRLQNRKRLSRGLPTGLATNHFLCSHGEGRGFQTTKYESREWGTGNGNVASVIVLPVTNVANYQFSQQSQLDHIGNEN